MTKVCIVGLGYVGFPLAQLCVKKGLTTCGIDLNKEKIQTINKGIDPIEKKPNQWTFPASTDDSAFIKNSEVIVICVPTPVDKLKMPDLEPVISSSQYVAKNLGKNKPIVVVESTINPGVMDDVVLPVFKALGHTVGKDYNLAHCPERVNPGDDKWNVSNIPRVVGGTTPECAERAFSFYSSLVDAKVTKMSSIKAAEATKIIENTFRDINIAFVNELAKSFSRMGIDVVEVIKGASTKPFAFMPHYPSCGVGGHCIPVDPYYLIEKAKSLGFDHKFLRLAREINNSMPEYTVELLVEALNHHKLSVNGSTIGVLGLTYKANVGDIRESPSLEVVEILKHKGANVVTYDPFVASDCKSLSEFQSKCDKIVLCTNHSEFANLDFSKVKILIDGKNMFYGKQVGCTYKGIGR